MIPLSPGAASGSAPRLSPRNAILGTIACTIGDNGGVTDTGFPRNCPTGGLRLEYSQTEGKAHFYVGPTHGVVMLPPRGIVYAQNAGAHR